MSEIEITGEIEVGTSEEAAYARTNARIDEIISLAEVIPTTTTAWLNENITPVGSAVVVDSSLSISGAAADSKVTGNNIKEICDPALKSFKKQLEIWESGYIDEDGNTASSTYRYRVKTVTTYPYDMEITVDDGYWGYLCFYENDTFSFRSYPFKHYAIPANTSFRVWVMSSNDTYDDGCHHIRFSSIGYAAYLKSQMLDNQKSIEFISWLRHGQLSTSGVFSPNIYRVSTYNIFNIGTDSIVTINSGYQADFAKYDDNGVFISRTGYFSGEQTLTKGNYRCSIKKANENQSELADVVEFAKSVTIQQSDLTKDSINQKSYNFNKVYPNVFDIADILNNSSISAITGTAIINTDITYQHEVCSYLLRNNGSTSPQDCRITLDSPISFYGIQEFLMVLYIPDVSNIDHFRFDSLSNGWNKVLRPTLSDGWNVIRINTNGTGMSSNATEYQFRLYTYYTDSTIISDIYLCMLKAVTPPHASLIFVEDAGYGSFYDYAYPLLSAIGCPITWAIECNGIHENRVGSRPLINLEELSNIEMDGMSELSWHGFNGELPVNLNELDTAKANLKCIRFLSKRGSLPSKIFRACWGGNTAPNHNLAIEELDACATYNGSADVTLYPYGNKYNIPRISLQTRNTNYIDELFDRLEKTHCTVYVYTHGIIDSTEFDTNSQDMRLDMLNYLISKMQTGMTEGWLKCTTYNRLEREYWN